MSFVRIDNGNLEYTAVQLHPKIEYLSSSIDQEVTGEAYVSPIRSKALKVVSSNILESTGEELIEKVNITNNISKFTKKTEIIRFGQSKVFDSNQVIKNNIVNVLMPYHEHRYQNCNYTYSNYHTLNFVMNDNFTTGSALLYANNNNIYDLKKEFSLNFWVNPRYSSKDYSAGTIFHLSSSMAVSLVPGNEKNERDEIDNFKILLQLSSSADLLPSDIDVNNITQNLVFTSSNYLRKNHWHHVCIQWGGKLWQNYTGSIFIDEVETKFYAGEVSSLGNKDVPALVIGNFYNGNYLNLAQLLGTDAVDAEGYTPLSTNGNPAVLEDNFTHPLKAELHDIKLFEEVLGEEIPAGETISRRKSEKERGLVKENFGKCQLYIPPFFYPKSNTRFVPVSVVERDEKSTVTPFNQSFSFRLGSHLLNLENYVLDMINVVQPRLINLKEKIGTDTSISGDDFIYNDGNLTKRNLSILPNDNGLFSPRYDIYEDKNIDTTIFKSPNLDYSTINLKSISNNSYHPGWNSPQDIVLGTFTDNDDLNNDLGFITTALGPNPFVRGREVIEPYKWIPQHTRDESSCEFVCYNISNIYYGNRIKPGSFEIYDNNLKGSDGEIKIRLKDNGLGSLYRADCKTKQAVWNNVGNLFYDEGLVFIKSPHMYSFCEERTEMNFRGEQNLHTMILNVPVYKDYFNSSSNPTYKSGITPSENANDVDKDSVYVTTVNIHDNNFNIIMKANFSQPIIKTDEDEFVIRLKEDF